MTQAYAEDDRLRIEQSKQIQTLLMPQEMGELFKVMALCKDYTGKLSGFTKGDKRMRL